MARRVWILHMQDEGVVCFAESSPVLIRSVAAHDPDLVVQEVLWDELMALARSGVYYQVKHIADWVMDQENKS